MSAISPWLRRARFTLPRRRHLSTAGGVVEGEDDEWVRVKRNVAPSIRSSIANPKFLTTPKQCTVIGAPMTFGQPLAGTDEGPELIRSLGLRDALTQLEWRVDDVGDLDFAAPRSDDPLLPKAAGKAKNCFAVGKSMETLSAAVYDSASAGSFPLTVGGDHSVAAGSVSGALQARPDSVVIWVDAHADINTPESSPSGNLHGMPIALLSRLVEPSTLPGWEWMEETPRLDPRDLIFIGLRDVDSGEVEMIRELGIPAFTMQHIDKWGIGGVMERALELAGTERPIHMSLDIDAVDPLHAPSTGTVVRGGLSYREAHYVVEAIGDTGQLASMDIVEVNPMLSKEGDGARQTAELALALVESAMGSRII